MLQQINFENILFLDIETVPRQPAYEQLDDRFKALWDHKSRFIRQEEEDTPETLYSRAGIYAEFGKVVCISAGYYRNQEFRIKSFYGDDEAVLLQEFGELINQYFCSPYQLLCGHNVKEFDLPYLARRMLIKGIPVPDIMDTAGKKPWEVAHLDTLELWKFGDYKHYTSLDLLSAIFDIPTSKDDINGADVGRVYWQEKDLSRIVHYCEKDVVVVAQLMRRFMEEPLIEEANIVHIS